VDIDTDHSNCGGCGIRCKEGLSCVERRCTTITCPIVLECARDCAFHGASCYAACEGSASAPVVAAYREAYVRCAGQFCAQPTSAGPAPCETAPNDPTFGSGSDTLCGRCTRPFSNRLTQGFLEFCAAEVAACNAATGAEPDGGTGVGATGTATVSWTVHGSPPEVATCPAGSVVSLTFHDLSIPGAGPIPCTTGSLTVANAPLGNHAAELRFETFGVTVWGVYGTSVEVGPTVANTEVNLRPRAESTTYWRVNGSLQNCPDGGMVTISASPSSGAATTSLTQPCETGGAGGGAYIPLRPGLYTFGAHLTVPQYPASPATANYPLPVTLIYEDIGIAQEFITIDIDCPCCEGALPGNCP
jgi:hypothetical protein